jgi:UDP-N-acetylmuramoylalanine--D-glutamate ligase
MMRPWFKDRAVLVIGAGKSGAAAARLLLKLKARVTLTDEKPAAQLRDALKGLPSDIRRRLGARRFVDRPYDLIVISPGVPWDHPELKKARDGGVTVWPELELGWRLARPYKTVAITGTNGKTTTTALLGHLLQTARRSVLVGGNIGTPLSALLPKITAKTYLVLEVSSYQLEAHQTFHPNVGLFLNLTPDHLARHKTMAGYAAAKARLFANFSPSDTAVLNGRDRWAKEIAGTLPSQIIFFPNPIDRRLARALRLPGAHNQENAMAASAAARALGLSAKQIKAGLSSFHGVAHRIEIVRERGGVLYINDSKATNVDSTLVALKSFRQKVILILGGEHKGAPYTPLKPLVRKGVRQILTIGEAAPLIAKDLKGAAPIFHAGTLERAVSEATRVAKRGDVVLLSPACASFDQFKNFEHRGDVFTRLVKGL